MSDSKQNNIASHKTTDSIGPLMLDIEGLSLNAREEQLLQHSLVGGLILFSRNYQDRSQLQDLITSVRELNPGILVAVDHEGGRVQRFREDFSAIPPMALLGSVFKRNQSLALDAAKEIAWLMATELRVHDIDFSFAPVLDLDFGCSIVIGDRAFSDSRDELIELANMFLQGFAEAGMATTGKHFPGHGFVEADSHIDIPKDSRKLEEIMALDASIFKSLVERGLNAIMPAHVIYETIDSQPAGFSDFWLKQVLRSEMGFDGVIFSDDLAMEGATVAGSFNDRARAALRAGCDMVLVCNAPAQAETVLRYLESEYTSIVSESERQASVSRLLSMRARPCAFDGVESLRQNQRWVDAQELVERVSS